MFVYFGILLALSLFLCVCQVIVDLVELAIKEVEEEVALQSPDGPR